MIAAEAYVDRVYLTAASKRLALGKRVRQNSEPCAQKAAECRERRLVRAVTVTALALRAVDAAAHSKKAFPKKAQKSSRASDGQCWKPCEARCRKKHFHVTQYYILIITH